MKRISKRIAIKELPADFKSKLWFWAQPFETFQWLDTNDYKNAYKNYQTVVAIDYESLLKINYKDAFYQMDKYYKNTNDFIFGYLGYDLKNDIEDLESQNFDGLQLPDLFFFQPKKLFLFTETHLEIAYLSNYSDQIDNDLKQIDDQIINHAINQTNFSIHQRMDFETYSKKFEQLQNYIHRGDTYETNFCMEFYGEDVNINPYEVYWTLNSINPMPFSAFIKHDNFYVMSASPERFAGKNAHKIVTQPIKGTRKRGTTQTEDVDIIKELKANTKERSENIMIVDLLRNDLSRIALKNSVNVEELCTIYIFPGVHQMISTITCEVEDTINVVEIIKALFPMGSMTGAPKISTMRIIEELEMHKRGVYSGAIGYISPEGNFDFSVVIRTILYNALNRYLSLSVGGAVTSEANVEAEYEECMIKAESLLKTLDKFQKRA